MANHPTAQSVLSSIEFALAVHLSRHGAEQRTQSMPAYVPGCAECTALHRAVQQARRLVEAPPAPTTPTRRRAA
jgi:hypothetical protein